MVRYLIIEDESLAYEELKRMMDLLRHDYQMAGWAQSITQSVALLKSQQFDLILADISLGDGLCFEIFEQIAVDIPVIFTTAYDEYAIKAFKANGIDYLLKPIEKEELESAIGRFEKRLIVPGDHAKMAKTANAYSDNLPKSRLLVQSGDTYMHINTNDVAAFYSEDKYTYLHLFSGRRYIVDYALDKLEQLLDGKCFFRISRAGIVNIRAITRCTKHFGGRLKLHYDPELPMEMHVSRSRSKDFLNWIDGKYN